MYRSAKTRIFFLLIWRDSRLLSWYTIVLILSYMAVDFSLFSLNNLLIPFWSWYCDEREVLGSHTKYLMFFRLSTDLYGPIHRSVRYRVVTMNKVKYNGGLTRKSGSNTVFDGTLENIPNKTFMRSHMSQQWKSCCVCCTIFFCKAFKVFYTLLPSPDSP